MNRRRQERSPLERTPSAATENDPRQPPRPWAGPFGYVLLGLWFGLCAGFVEMAGLSLERLLGIQPLWFLSGHYLWMSILANLLLFAPLGVVFGVLAACFPRLPWLRGAVVFLSFWFALVLVAYVSQILGLGLSVWATLLLALGLAVWAARWATARPDRFHRLVATSGGVLLAALVVLAVGVIGLGRWADRRSLDALGPASPDAPNVLLIVMDTVRAKSLGLYGCPRPTTPALTRWAKESVVFENAVSPAPWTLPSHASMFTGLYPDQHGCDQTVPLGTGFPTLAEVLRRRGYATAGFVGNIRFCHRYTGLARGFIHWQDGTINWGELAYNSWLARHLLDAPRVKRALRLYDELGRKSASTVNSEFLDWLRRRPRKRPFFAFLNYYDAHDPFLPEGPVGADGQPLSDAQKAKLANWRRAALFVQNVPPQDIAVARRAYEARIRRLDAEIDSLLSTLEREGLLRNTLLVITADHGEQFGEHGLLFHWNSLYRPLLHVPLLIRFPDRSGEGRRVTPIVNLRDLPASMLEMLGLEEEAFPGDSFAPLCDGSATPGAVRRPTHASVEMRDYLPPWQRNASGPIEALFGEGMQYIREYGTGKEELYDFLHDLEEEHDLSGDTAYGNLLERFRQIVVSARPPHRNEEAEPQAAGFLLSHGAGRGEVRHGR